MRKPEKPKLVLGKHRPFVSDRRIAANRANALKSTGPKTEAGKKKSRGNALKHGFTSTVIEIPDENPQCFDHRLSEWQASLNPDDNPADRWCVRRAVVLSIRVERLEVVHDAAVAELARSADRKWDDDRNAEVESLSRIMFTDNADSAYRRLRLTTQGCDYLLRLWGAVMITIEGENPPWDFEDDRVALRLLNNVAGVSPKIPSMLTPHTLAIYEHQVVAQKLKENENPDVLTWDRKYSNQTSHDHDKNRVAAMKIRAEIAQGCLKRILNQARADLVTFREQLSKAEAIERSQVGWRLRFDASDQGKLHHRYEQDAERGILKLLKEVRSRPKSVSKEPASTVVSKPRTAPRNEPKPEPASNPISDRKPVDDRGQTVVGSAKVDPKPRR